LKRRRLRKPVGEQRLGVQQAARLQVLQRCHAVFGGKDAAQMAVAHAQAFGRSHERRGLALSVEHVDRVQQAGGLACQRGRRIHHRPCQTAARRHFGAALQARAKALRLGLCGAVEEAAVLAPRRAHAADRPAVNAGAGDADEQPAVEAGVAGFECEISSVVVERHAAMIGRARPWTRRFRTCA
jgi:hypothetical protein